MLMLYNNGRQLAAAGRPDEARIWYQRALKVDPTFTLARQALESPPPPTK
jgi:tetratricopeptide (TPR) repeat protein